MIQNMRFLEPAAYTLVPPPLSFPIQAMETIFPSAPDIFRIPAVLPQSREETISPSCRLRRIKPFPAHCEKRPETGRFPYPVSGLFTCFLLCAFHFLLFFYFLLLPYFALSDSQSFILGLNSKAPRYPKIRAPEIPAADAVSPPLKSPRVRLPQNLLT